MSEVLFAQELEDELACVAIPTPGATLLLPNVCVAEIVKLKAIKPVENGPDWLVGQTGWRGQTISVVRFAGFDEPNPSDDGSRCLVVMNRSKVPQAPSFYALIATGLPRILQLLPSDLKNHDESLGPADAMKVIVGTEAATIPDLGYVETCLKEVTAQLSN
ncbi:MAG: chemotaxis protein CheW [Pseudomonadota bacterium]